MGLTYLLDTNILSEVGKLQGDAAVVAKYSQYWARSAVAAPSLHELQFGLERMPDGLRKNTLRRFVVELLATGPVVLAYDREAALLHARERARLTDRGTPPPFVDSQVAGIALHHDLTLVTRNVKDFRRFEGLRVENWFTR